MTRNEHYMNTIAVCYKINKFLAGGEEGQTLGRERRWSEP